MRLVITAALSMLLLPTTLIMGVNYHVDPYQYYRKWPGDKPIFSTNGRYQNPGLARHYSYDTVIVGTSRSENFTPGMFAEAGWQVMKLTAAGSDSLLHGKTLRTALDTGKVKRAIVELSATAYMNGPDYVRQGRSFPNFLYEPSIETPFRYLLSYDLFEDSLRILRGKGKYSTLEELNVWQPRYQAEFGKLTYLQGLTLDCQPLVDVDPAWRGDYPLMDAALAQNLEVHLKAHPKVEFLGYLPPYPIVWFGSARRESRRVQFGFRHRVYDLAARYPNFTLFDFAFMHDIVDDPRRYKDVNHYDQATNKAMAMAMVRDRRPSDETDAITANERLIELADHFEWTKWAACADEPARIAGTDAAAVPDAAATTLFDPGAVPEDIEAR